MRTFQYSDAKSHKFWNIEVNGNSFTVTYGKIGSAGQNQTKTFPSAEKAQAEAEKVSRKALACMRRTHSASRIPTRSLP
jgi:predicted DNA-binding WGR domain protein